ncbi:MAG: hypothetical protein KAU21_18125 [Gammaproteobacteria bacterium]|nr:hypothetical protein [Gammaproteobacteria bacterium]
MKKIGLRPPKFTSIRAVVKPPCGHIAAGIGLSACLTLNAFAFDRNDIGLSAEVLLGKENDSTVDTETKVKTFYGTLTLPLISRFNVHLEGAIENAENELTAESEVAGAGMHAYWRHPDYGLLGLTISDTTAEIKPVDGLAEQIKIKGKTTGLELEAYMGPVMLALQGGRVSSDLEELDDENYSAADIYISASAELYVHGGTRTFSNSTSNSLEAGYTFPFAVTFYGGTMWDEFDNQYVGLEYVYVTGSKSNLVFTLEADKGEDDFEAIYFSAYFGFGAVENAPLIPLFAPASGGFR